LSRFVLSHLTVSSGVCMSASNCLHVRVLPVGYVGSVRRNSTLTTVKITSFYSFFFHCQYGIQYSDIGSFVCCSRLRRLRREVLVNNWLGRKPETIDYGSARAGRLKDFSPFCTVGLSGWWFQRDLAGMGFGVCSRVRVCMYVNMCGCVCVCVCVSGEGGVRESGSCLSA